MKKLEQNKDRELVSGVVLIRIIIILLLSIVMYSSLTLAITGSSGTITTNAILGSASYNSNNQIITSTAISSNILGAYSKDLLTGFIGLHGLNDSENLSSLTILITSPNNNYLTNNTDVDLKFNITGDNAPDSCDVYLDGSVYGNLIGPNLGENILALQNLNASRHFVNVSCLAGLTIYNSQTNKFTIIIIPSSFDNESTDLTTVDIENITNLTFSKSGFGKIVFNDNINLSSGGDLASNIIIGNNYISINSNVLSSLNRSAILTMSNMSTGNVAILRDGVPCSTCKIISYSPGVLIFNVTGFSVYTTTSSTTLDVWDDTDSIQKYPGDFITFYANYTNVSSGQALAGECNISIDINGSWTPMQLMSYNLSNGIYYYSEQFNYSISSQFNVTCAPSSSGFDVLSLIDTFTNNGIPNSFSDIQATVVGSSRHIEDNSPAVIISQGGNLTELIVDGNEVTKSWQGYYGDISNTVVLRDADSNSMYNWNSTIVTGEIYASRSLGINWNAIACADNAKLISENTFIGAGSDGDSVFNTFRNTTSITPFYVGVALINLTDNCYTTNLYDTNGPQSVNYAQILLTDGSNIIYTTILSNDALGFDNSTNDFELLVGEDGHNDDTNPTMYYFFAELG